nr:PREDICTED: collagen alpha-1(XXIII) chain-like [Rhinolophus sinicus]
MSRGERNVGDAQKGCPAGGGGGGGGRPATAAGTWAVSALCLLLSVGSAAACLLLGAQAAALQGRVEALEEERQLLRRAGPPGSLAAWAEPHLERLLREKLDGLVKLRTAREAPTECVCPPGPRLLHFQLKDSLSSLDRALH